MAGTSWGGQGAPVVAGALTVGVTKAVDTTTTSFGGDVSAFTVGVKVCEVASASFNGTGTFAPDAFRDRHLGWVWNISDSAAKITFNNSYLTATRAAA